MRTPPKIIKVLAGTIAVLLALQAGAIAANRRNGGPVTALRTASEAGTVHTEVVNRYRMVDGMSVTMRVPDGQQAHFVITFSAASHCSDQSGTRSAYCFVEVSVDGAPASPGQVVFDSAPDGTEAVVAWETNSMQFVSGPHGPGTHGVKVKYRVDEAGSSFSLDTRTLTVMRSRV